jgi:flagellum-specific ATP synthase
MHLPLDELLTAELNGSVVETIGSTLAVADFPAPVGSIVEVERSTGGAIDGEVIGFRDRAAMVFAFQGTSGVRRGNRVRLARTVRRVRVGQALLGRVVDADAKPIDGRPQPMLPDRVRIDSPPESPAERPRIVEPLATGVRAIDGLLTCGRGQRLGIFAGSGVGKSVLLGMMCRYTAADVVVIALVGERGRELNEFLERDLGPDGLARSVVVVATSNEPALRRTQAAFTATAIAEYYRDQGQDVLLLMDSITRFAMAQREIGLSAGEPPTTRGYPPSMFSTLPKLVERAGRTKHGSITAYYSVLVEGDDANEPVADTMRGLLDGHVWLSRKLAARGHYPAIDVLDSISRLMNDLTDDQQRNAAQVLRRLLAIHQENEDLLSIGAYRKGNNRLLDVAIEMRPSIDEFLRQRVAEPAALRQTRADLVSLGTECQQRLDTQIHASLPTTAAGMNPALPVGTA